MSLKRLALPAALALGFVALGLVAAPVEAHASRDVELEASPALVLMADGKAVYMKKCKKCHGDDGKAKTRMGEKHKIKDMTTADWKAKWSKDKIVGIVTDGKKGTKMKSYKDKLSAEEISAVADYVRTLK